MNEQEPVRAPQIPEIPPVVPMTQHERLVARFRAATTIHIAKLATRDQLMLDLENAKMSDPPAPKEVIESIEAELGEAADLEERWLAEVDIRGKRLAGFRKSQNA